MKKLLILFVLFASTFVLNAQQSEYYSYTLKNTTPLRANIYYQALTNIATYSDINVDLVISQKIEEIANKTYQSNKKANNSNVWLLKPLFSMTELESDADVIVSGNYQLEKITESTEKLLYESSSSFAAPIPYFELEISNKVELQINMDYSYKDGPNQSDTMIITKESVRQPKTKFKSMDELVVECNKELKLALYNEFDFIERKSHNYKLPKVKVSDKSLKDSYKNAKDLFSNGEISKLGNLYKRIYESENTKEAAYCLGVCYELIGNYPKAQDYYNQMPDFHTKTRLKNSMELFNYLTEIGIELTLEEF